MITIATDGGSREDAGPAGCGVRTDSKDQTRWPSCTRRLENQAMDDAPRG